jgi:hypothetical protein|tara:strand:+ start:1058 stop:1252 length:195 start_codon:yes stop_codon:yes gene_type:complete
VLGFYRLWLTRDQLTVHAMPDWIDPRSLLDTVIIVSIVALAAVGFVVGMKQMIIDLSNLRRAKV